LYIYCVNCGSVCANAQLKEAKRIKADKNLIIPKDEKLNRLTRQQLLSTPNIVIMPQGL
jgi:hypothetical protein